MEQLRALSTKADVSSQVEDEEEQEEEKEEDHDDLFASQLAEAFLPPSPAADGVLKTPGITDLILSFFPASQLIVLGRTCKAWHDYSQRHLRILGVEVLQKSGGLSLSVAQDVESQLALRCTHRGPGAYSDKLRMFVANLRMNAPLVLGLENGSLASSEFVQMTSASLATASRAYESSRIRQRAIEEAQMREPPADLRGHYQCKCGCTKQWVRRHMRHGLVDKFTEVLVCCDCLASVTRDSVYVDASLRKVSAAGVVVAGKGGGAGGGADNASLSVDKTTSSSTTTSTTTQEEIAAMSSFDSNNKRQKQVHDDDDDGKSRNVIIGAGAGGK